MKRGHLSQYFSRVASKRLSAVEADTSRSNQHEFNGTAPLRALFGECGADKIRLSGRFLYLSDDDDHQLEADRDLTWYDARAKARLERGVDRHECRLYFETSSVMERAAEGDLLIVGRQQDGRTLVIVAAMGTTVERQLAWLFGLESAIGHQFALVPEEKTDAIELGLAAKLVLEYLGIEAIPEEKSFLDEMLARFGGAFPATREFSAYARETVGKDVNAVEDPDTALARWWEQEESLFKTFERHFVQGRIASGFGADVNEFLTFSLSVHNRRKSRAGNALENHMARILDENRIPYSARAMTEPPSRPDFVFPGIAQYRDESYPQDKLVMLGVKSTCKDRWRQVLSEAHRIRNKHLLTLEPGISEDQTEEMSRNRLQLVIPNHLHTTYTPAQRKQLLGLKEFLAYIGTKCQ